VCGPGDLGVIPGGVEHEAWFHEDTGVIDERGERADKAYEFAWSFNPVPIKGATGSPGNSVAIA